MQHLYISSNSQLCMVNKHTQKCIGVQKQKCIGVQKQSLSLKATYPPAYVQMRTQIQQNQQKIQKPHYTLKIRIVPRDIQDKSQNINIIQGSKVYLINTYTQQYIICTSTGQIKFDKKTTLSEQTNKHLYKASTWTIQFYKNQNKVIQSNKDIITVFDQLCFKSVHSTYLTVKNISNQLYATTQVDSIKSVWNMIKANVPYIPEWVFKRNSFNKFSKLTIGQQQSLINSNSQQQNLRQKKLLKSFPPQIQQSLLIQDILDIMLGFEGVYIKRRKQRNQFAIQPYLQQPTCNIALSQLVYKILQLPRLQNKVQSYISTYSIHEGTICQALCGALRKLVKEYKMMIIQFDQLAKQSLTLQKLWYLSQGSLKVMQALALLVDQAEKYRGGQLITCITKLLNQNTDKQIIQIYNFIFRTIMQVYIQMLSKWLYQGIIQDKYGQFMIMNQAQNIHNQWNYWQQKFLIRQNQIPAILTKQANHILVTGKYLNILKACNKLTDHPFNKQIIYEFQKFTEMQNFTQPITRAYEWTNTQMLKLVFDDYKFNDVLKSIKGYYFMEYGDLFVHFLDVAIDDLSILKNKKDKNQNAKQFSQQKIKNLFQLLIRTSSANNDQFKDQVSCRVQNISLYDQMHRIKQFQTKKLNYDFIQKPFVKTNSKYIDYLTLDYKFKFPLTLIFNKRNMSKYQTIFRYLFWCKYAQRKLNNTWVYLKQTKQLGLTFLTPFYLLCQKMIHFIKSFIHYICYEVIQQNWQIFKQNLKKVKTFQDIIKCHSNFLDKCLIESLLSNSSLLQQITSDLGATIQSFCNSRTMITQTLDNKNFQQFIKNKTISIVTLRKQFIQVLRKQIYEQLFLMQKQQKSKPYKQLLTNTQTSNLPIKAINDNFDDCLKRIFRQIYILVLKQQNNMLNLLNRLDQERYYNKRLFNNQNQIYMDGKLDIKTI